MSDMTDAEMLTRLLELFSVHDRPAASGVFFIYREDVCVGDIDRELEAEMRRRMRHGAGAKGE